MNVKLTIGTVNSPRLSLVDYYVDPIELEIKAAIDTVSLAANLDLHLCIDCGVVKNEYL